MLATTRKNPQWIATIMGNVTRVAGSEIACGFPKQKANAYPDGDSVADVAAKNCFGIGVIQRDLMTYAQPGFNLLKSRTLSI